MLPTLTPPGWTTLVTGAWPSTHKVMDFNIYKPGARIDQTEWGINTRLSKAEYLWNTIERAGATPLLVKYEMSWPRRCRAPLAVQVEGTGPGISNHAQIAGYHLFAVGRQQQQERHRAIGRSLFLGAARAAALRSGSARRDEHGLGLASPPESAREPLFAELTIEPLSARTRS